MKTKTKPTKQVYVYKGEPITSPELIKLRDRCIGQAKDAKNAMEFTAMHRLALDADYLSLLLDRETGQKRFDMWVQVTPKKRAQPKTAKKR